MTTALQALKNEMDRTEAEVSKTTLGTKARARAERAAWAAFVAFRDVGGFSAMLADVGPGHWRSAR